MSASTESVHISSLVVHCFPEKLDAVIKSTETFNNVDVTAHDISGKFVAVLETESEQGILSIIDQIQALEGVLTTTMVYHELDC